ADGQFLKTIRSVLESAKSIPLPMLFYFKQLVKQRMGNSANYPGKVLHSDFLRAFEVQHPPLYHDVNKQLLADMGFLRLKSFLKCEDRCGMWHSVESRTPFSDDPELMHLAFSFNGTR